MNTPSAAATLATLILAVSPSAAAAPANDDFSNATDLGTTTITTTTGSTVEATEEFGEPNPHATPGVEPFATAWWKFAVPADGFVEISTTGSDFDTVLAVYTGNDLFALIESASDNDGGTGTTSRLTFAAFAGSDYFIQIGGANLEQGTVSLSIAPGSEPTPPTLTSITLQPSPIDVTSTSGVVTATLQIDSPDGFDYGQLSVLDPTDVDTGEGGTFTSTSRISGDEFSGIYEIALAISTYSPPGTYRIDLSLLEINGDSAAHGQGAQAWPSGSTGTFEVINGGTVDNSPPAISAFSFAPNNVDVTSAPGTLAVTVQATDDLGVQFMVIDIYDPDNFYLFSALAPLASGTVTSGTWTTNVAVATGSSPGIWRIEVRAIDFSSKTTTYTPSADEDEFTVVNNGATDEDPPTLVDLSFSPNPVVRGNPVTVNIQFADNLSGLAAGCIEPVPRFLRQRWEPTVLRPVQSRRPRLRDRDGGHVAVPDHDPGDRARGDLEYRDRLAGRCRIARQLRQPQPRRERVSLPCRCKRPARRRRGRRHRLPAVDRALPIPLRCRRRPAGRPGRGRMAKPDRAAVRRRPNHPTAIRPERRKLPGTDHGGHGVQTALPACRSQPQRHPGVADRSPRDEICGS